VLVQRGVAFPYTHDLARLITLAQSAGLPWPEVLEAAATLTVYAAGSRYPGPGGEILDAEYRQATVLAHRVLDWAEHLIRGPAENEVTEGHA
jgi:HEPN domain-containing protein